MVAVRVVGICCFVSYSLSDDGTDCDLGNESLEALLKGMVHTKRLTIGTIVYSVIS
jgi:hypothetical protein